MEDLKDRNHKSGAAGAFYRTRNSKSYANMAAESVHLNKVKAATVQPSRENSHEKSNQIVNSHKYRNGSSEIAMILR